MSNHADTIGFAKIGQDVVVWPLAKIVQADRITVGNSVIIDDFVFLMGGQETVIADFVHIASFASCTGGGRLWMADFSALSSGVRVFTGNEDYSGASLTNPTVPFPYRKPVRSYVRIGKHVVVGANSVVLPGVTIGEGAVISPNSVVVADCAPWTVYVGSPARAVKARPPQKILDLEGLLRSKVYTPDVTYIPRDQWSVGGADE